MGNQLWTSPITGYRRKGTRLAELRALLGDGITARAVLEPLQSCSVTATAVNVAALLGERDFDLGGVQLQPDGPVIGLVSRDALQEGLVRDPMQRLATEDLVSDATPLATVLSVLKGRPWVCVLVGQNVSGIVTRADLNKPPVRVYLFGLISLLEMHVGFWIRDAYPGETWKEALAPARLKKAEDVQSLRQSRNQATTLFDCLQFCDKRDLLLKRAKLRTSLQLGVHARARLERAEKLRDLLAHSQDDLAENSSWPNLIELVEWIEATVQRSDALVEEKAKASAKGHFDALWVSA